MAEYSESFDALDAEIQGLSCELSHAKEQATGWEAVARNLAQVLELRDGDGTLILSQQMKAHGVVK